MTSKAGMSWAVASCAPEIIHGERARSRGPVSRGEQGKRRPGVTPFRWLLERLADPLPAACLVVHRPHDMGP
jgi:hypothetical protein